MQNKVIAPVFYCVDEARLADDHALEAAEVALLGRDFKVAVDHTARTKSV